MKNYKIGLALAVLCMTLSAPAFADRLVLSIGTPPPAPIVETIPVAPGPEYVWHPGHYRWVPSEGVHVWVPGHYVVAPHPGAVWIAPRWVQGPNGYVFYEGRWR